MKNVALAVILLATSRSCFGYSRTSQIVHGFFTALEGERTYLYYKDHSKAHRLFFLEEGRLDIDGNDRLLIQGRFFVIQLATNVGTYTNHFFQRTDKGMFSPLFKSRFNGMHSVWCAADFSSCVVATVAVSPDYSNSASWESYLFQFTNNKAMFGEVKAPFPDLRLSKSGPTELMIVSHDGTGANSDVYSRNRVPLKLDGEDWCLQKWSPVRGTSK